MAGLLTRWSARALHATRAIDRAYHRGDRFRSLLVLAFGSDAFLDEYCRLAYDHGAAYNAASTQFRTGLFEWETEAIDRCFPPPPARILVGGAGGGREPYALVEQGYDVVAFDPAAVLVRSMQARARRDYSGKLQAYCGRYENLPLLSAGDGSNVDLRQRAPFDAAMLGWGSFTHLLTDAGRVDALTRVGQLTGGPMLVSYHPSHRPAEPPSGRGPIAALRRRAGRRGRAAFTPGTGYVRFLTREEIEDITRMAGLEVVCIEHARMWPYAIVRRPSSGVPRRQ